MNIYKQTVDIYYLGDIPDAEGLVTTARDQARGAAYVSIRQHTSAFVGIRQHTSAYVSIRSIYAAQEEARGAVVMFS